MNNLIANMSSVNDSYSPSYTPACDIIDLFNKANEKQPDRFVKSEELQDGHHYVLRQLNVVPTRFGNALVAELADGTSPPFKTFLPRRYLDTLGGRPTDAVANEFGLSMVFTNVKDKRITSCRIVKTRIYA
jgi:hypothetical protein